MNLRILIVCVVAIIVLLMLGPDGTAYVLKGIGGWFADFLNAL
jgi:hypothetical protein